MEILHLDFHIKSLTRITLSLMRRKSSHDTGDTYYQCQWASEQCQCHAFATPRLAHQLILSSVCSYIPSIGCGTDSIHRLQDVAFLVQNCAKGTPTTKLLTVPFSTSINLRSVLVSGFYHCHIRCASVSTKRTSNLKSVTISSWKAATTVWLPGRNR